MRLIGNYYSEWADARGDTRRTLLVTLVACAVGATASAAVIFSLASSTTQSSAPPISPRAIVRNVGAPEVPKTVQDGPVVEPTPSPQATVRNAGAFEVPKAPVEPTSRPAAASMVSGRNVSVTQTEAEARAEVHSQQSRRHTRVREPYWRRFAHNPWPKPFGSW